MPPYSQNPICMFYLQPIILTMLAKVVYAKIDASLFKVVVFFTLTDRASTIPSNIRGCQSSTWLPIQYVVCWTERDQRNIYQAPMKAKEKHKHTKNDEEKVYNARP